MRVVYLRYCCHFSFHDTHLNLRVALQTPPLLDPAAETPIRGVPPRAPSPRQPPPPRTQTPTKHPASAPPSPVQGSGTAAAETIAGGGGGANHGGVQASRASPSPAKVRKDMSAYAGSASETVAGGGGGNGGGTGVVQAARASPSPAKARKATPDMSAYAGGSPNLKHAP